MYCPRCGTRASEGDSFCKACGAKLPSPGAARPAPEGTGDGEDDRSASGGRGHRSVSRRGAIAIGCGAAAAVAAAAVAGVLHARSGGGDDSGGGSGSVPTSGTFEGTTVTAMSRPQLVSIPSDDTTPAAPGLSRYRTDSSEAADTHLEQFPSLDLSGVANAEVFGDVLRQEGLASKLREQGFVVEEASWDEFYEVYEYNRYELRANFVTVDSLMHTYHLYFSHLLKGTEKATLSDRLSSMGAALLQASLDQYDTLAGTEWDGASRRNVTFFAVAQQLMGQQASVPSSLSDAVSSEVSAVESASGTSVSSITGQQEDYTQYKPRGYYEGDDQLERYFRTMMWYGRTNFTQNDEDLDRSACLMTLALHDAGLADWEAVYAITSFFAGASDDCGYYEYYPLIEAAYGGGATAQDLVGNADAWDGFHAATATMDPPKINSVIYVDDGTGGNTDELEQARGFRLMGQRFSLDEAIFEQLLPRAIGQNTAGEDRTLPSGLDVTAALGSDAALSLLSDEGVTDYDRYSEQMEALRAAIANADNSLWTASLYSQWLYTLNPLLAVHGEGYPDFMRTSVWDRRNLQTYLGSYTELKHDTVLYAKQVMVEMGGGGIDQVDDRGYVEPEAELYRRMQNLVSRTSTGLSGYGALSDDDASNLQILASLAGQLADIAEAELSGTSLTDDQYELIRSYGGQLEHFWTEVYKDEASSGSITARDFPAAVVTDVASNGTTGTCLELGTGTVNEIYVLFELDGALHVAGGGSYSYYEFEQPMTDRLTDSEWRQMMGIESPDGMTYSRSEAKEQPSWVDDFTYGYR